MVMNPINSSQKSYNAAREDYQCFLLNKLKNYFDLLFNLEIRSFSLVSLECLNPKGLPAIFNMFR